MILSTNSDAQQNPRILNAMMSMNSGMGSDAPIINIFEVITNDLTSSNLENYICTLRNEEKKIYGFNINPYIINADCGKNILLACLHAYNNESYTEYIRRMLSDLHNEKKHDNSKVIIGWCYGHSIRAVCQYVKDKKFVMSCQCKCCSKKILSKFAMKIWNNVRVQETLYNAEINARLWHWILEQKTLKLENLEIDISKISNLTSLDLEYDFNEELFVENSDLDNSLDKEDIDNISEIYENSLQNNNEQYQQYNWNYTFNGKIILQIFEEDTNSYALYFPLINLKVSTVGFNDNNIHNPFFNINLQQYLKNTWWKTLVLWGNIVTQIRERSRRTTATIEVENKIIKHYDIKQRNLDLDKYLYERINILKANQLLVADRLMNYK
jgi:hypothetical protein